MRFHSGGFGIIEFHAGRDGVAPMILGDLLLAYRTANKISCRQLGARIGISYQVITRIEAGRGVSARALWDLVEWMMGDGRRIKESLSKVEDAVEGGEKPPLSEVESEIARVVDGVEGAV